MMGGPASGKGTICAEVVKRSNSVHVSSGDLLREEVQRRTPLGAQASFLGDCSQSGVNLIAVLPFWLRIEGDLYVGWMFEVSLCENSVNLMKGLCSGFSKDSLDAFKESALQPFHKNCFGRIGRPIIIVTTISTGKAKG